MAKATAHPDRRLISSEDVEGTEVYGSGDEVLGEIDHLLIERVSGRAAYAVMSFGGFLGLAHSHYLKALRERSTSLTPHQPLVQAARVETLRNVCGAGSRV